MAIRLIKIKAVAINLLSQPRFAQSIAMNTHLKGGGDCNIDQWRLPSTPKQQTAGASLHK